MITNLNCSSTEEKDTKEQTGKVPLHIQQRSVEILSVPPRDNSSPIRGDRN